MTAIETLPPIDERPQGVRNDDFLLLGIPGQENRPDVIRHAVKNAAAPWVRRSLKGYSAKSEQELAKILSSGYRALEPRLRPKLTERVGLCLTDPNPPVVEPAPWSLKAGTRQRVRDRFDAYGVLPRAVRRAGEGSRGLSGRSSLARGRWLAAMAGVFVALVFGGFTFRALLGGRPTDAQHPGVTASGGPAESSAIGGAGGAETSTGKRANGTNDPHASADMIPLPKFPEFPNVAPGATRPDPTKQDVPNTPASPESEKPARDRKPPRETEPAKSTPAAAAKQDVKTEQRTGPPTLPPAMNFDGANTDGATAAVSGNASQPAAGINGTSNSGAANGTTKSPEQESQPQETKPQETKPSPAVEPTKPADTQKPADAPKPADTPKPADAPKPAEQPPESKASTGMSEDELKQARQRLGELLDPNLEGAARTAQLQKLYDATTLGSVDRYVVMEAMLDLQVLEQGSSEAMRGVTALSDQFSEPAFRIAVTAALRLSEIAKTGAEADRVVQWCLRAAELALRQEDFESASEAAKAAATVAARATSNELRLRVRQYRDGIAAAKRAQVPIPETADGASATLSGQVGRYLCLHLSDWDRGVSWLQGCSDVKLSRAAKADAAGDTVEAADTYLELAKHQRGRTGDSLRLRARELLVSAAAKAQGLEAEQLRRRIAAIESDLPVDLRDPVVIVPRKPVAPAAGGQAAGGQVAGGQAGRSTMLGRIRSANRDLGVLMRYPAGLTLAKSGLDQIFQSLKLAPEGELEVEFIGYVSLPKATTVQFLVKGPRPPAGKSALRIDERPVVLEPQGEYLVVQLELPAGDHSLTWRTQTSAFDAISFAVVDAITENSIPVLHDARMEAKAMSIAPTLANVRVTN